MWDVVTLPAKAHPGEAAACEALAPRVFRGLGKLNSGSHRSGQQQVTFGNVAEDQKCTQASIIVACRMMSASSSQQVSEDMVIILIN
ncbi:hypothetical protein ACJ73_01607 [Blastomyces percursus]|uniref:Uncharacterized protein n=1 Tax=Blastomyces percursus TaxID=1658174 RepID=A0A1J9QFY0_9EURO|nr:hypothetical protein ACJ73_01607 [Blastomyces percursus]